MAPPSELTEGKELGKETALIKILLTEFLSLSCILGLHRTDLPNLNLYAGSQHLYLGKGTQ